jgi:hypothetical protein
LILTWYSFEAPDEPPEPPVPVTVPVLKLAQIVDPSAGVAKPRVGETGATASVQVLIVVHTVGVQP